MTLGLDPRELHQVVLVQVGVSTILAATLPLQC